MYRLLQYLIRCYRCLKIRKPDVLASSAQWERYHNKVKDVMNGKAINQF